ncbi:R3H domain-containing protein [Mycena kentingensis (nom. inval.)]|nr:R3H domain-containing protein [Mycena kentingensis (nom. inval.)]
MEAGPDNPADPPESHTLGRSNHRRNRQRPRDANNAPPSSSRREQRARSAARGQDGAPGQRSRGGGRRPPRDGPMRADGHARFRVVKGKAAARLGKIQETGTSTESGSRRRGAKFNAGLTNDVQPAHHHAHPRPKPVVPVADDLTSRLTAALGTPPYPDCPICFSAVHPAQPTWSCSPSIPVLDAQQFCWTTFHLKCVRAWAQKSIKEVANAWAARGEPERGGELVCSCGLTVYEPPIPCGTVMQCPHPCSRPLPLCGHPRTPHSCHPDDVACPPCPFLTSKQCMCGKKTVGNVRCSQERVGCGAVCGKMLACGAHTCDRVCHAPEGEGDEGGCGPCTAPCGKPRRLCHPAHHPCTAPCHAPSACDESTPCTAVITVACPCGRIRQQLQCGKSPTNPAGRRETQVKCTNECLVAKRNARLAEALGITPESRAKFEEVTWNDEVRAFARANARFMGIVEKAFADFVSSEKKTQVLPHMPPDRRKFVHDVAAVYRMDTQMVDQEPHRSVQLLRRYDTRVPTPLLSSVVAGSTNPAATSGGLGKLATADLRGGGSWRSPQTQAQPKVDASKAPRGWGAPAAAVPSTAAVATAPSRPPGIPAAATNTTAGAVPQTPTAVPDDWEDEE